MGTAEDATKPLPLAVGGDSAPAVPELLQACGRGDREAWARLFDECKDHVYSLALHLSGDATEAADIAQEVFLKVLTRLHQFRARAQFSTWLHRVVVNTFLDRRRAARRLVPLERAAVPPAATVPLEEALRRADTARLVARSVRALPLKLRVPLVLRFVAGLSYDQIADVLGVPPGTVASRLSRALEALARALPARRDLEV